MPFGKYKDFDACEKENGDKDDPGAYCGAIKHKIENKKENFISPYIRVFEDVPIDLVPKGIKTKNGIIKVRIDVTGNNDWKEIQDSYSGELTVQQLFTKLKDKPALSKFLYDIPVSRNIQNQKLKDITKTDVVELAIVSNEIHLVNRPLY